MPNGFKMRRVHTRPVPAQVVEFCSLGDWADEFLVGEPMRENVLLGRPVYADASVTVLDLIAEPGPAISRAADGYLGPEPALGEFHMPKVTHRQILE